MEHTTKSVADQVRHRRHSRSRRESVEGYLFISPWLLGFFLFTLGPLIFSFVISFTNWDAISAANWVGLLNYRKLFFEDFRFWNTMRVTFLYVLISVPLQMILSLSIAMILNERLHGLIFFRTVIYLPSVISGVAVALIWQWIFSPSYGLVNYWLKRIGITPPGWFSDPRWALIAMVVVGLWGLGATMMVYLAGLQAIPTQLYEAALMDGAGFGSRLVKITLPMISPTVLLNAVVSVIGAFQVFAAPLLLTKGGPGDATLFYALYLYYNAFNWFRMSKACALAWVLFIIVVVCTVVIFKTSASWVYYEGEKDRRR